MTVWLLLMGFVGSSAAFVVPDISSEQECHRLAETLNATAIVISQKHYCFSYQKAVK